MIRAAVGIHRAERCGGLQLVVPSQVVWPFSEIKDILGPA
jgi:hypothetical protein